MNNNICLYFKIKQKKYKRYYYCTLFKKEIQYQDCKICIQHEHKKCKTEKQIYNIKKEITYSRCRECVNKEYHFSNISKMDKTYTLKQRTPLKKRTSRQTKKEKDRFSIIYQDLSKCCICGSEQCVEINEVFEGAYRQTSIRLGMVVPFCHKHHQRFHRDRLFNLKYKAMFQKEYENTHFHEEFIGIFKQNYVYLYKKSQPNDQL